MADGGGAGSLQARLEFVHDGRAGRILVACSPSLDPLSIGKPEHARGFPQCTARLEFESGGYAAFFGWIQFVRSTDNRSRGRVFEIDPLGWFPDSRSPYAFFGLLPTLFDAPSRGRRKSLTWIAHSFLAATPIYNVVERVLRLRQVNWVAGFEWGFRITDQGEIELLPLRPTGPEEWPQVLPPLRREYRTWKFPLSQRPALEAALQVNP
jgi:hypothetical protein